MSSLLSPTLDVALGGEVPLCSKNITQFDPTKDYSKSLNPDELKSEGKKTFVFLRGLERLAKERGVLEAVCTRLEQLGTSGVMCTYSYSFVDGAIYQGSADATVKNCDGNFKLYLTAMAESRAKARALRTAFAITLCSVEEKSNVDIADDRDLGPAEGHQIVAIKNIAKEKGLVKEQVLELMDIPKTDFKKLSREEARSLIAALNDWKKPRITKKKAVRRRLVVEDDV